MLSSCRSMYSSAPQSLVTPVLAKTQILKFYQPDMGKQEPKTSIIAQTYAKAVDSLYARICLRTSNLLDSYYRKINFSETSLDIRTSSFVYIKLLPEEKFKQNSMHWWTLLWPCCNLVRKNFVLYKWNDVETESRLGCRKRLYDPQVKKRRDRELSRLPKTMIRSTSETT